jgi:hypothetical protein
MTMMTRTMAITAAWISVLYFGSMVIRMFPVYGYQVRG